MRFSTRSRWLTSLTLLVLAVAVPAAGASFVNFESGQVRPLALSADATRLYAVNTPDARLEILHVTAPRRCALRRSRSGSDPDAVRRLARAPRRQPRRRHRTAVRQSRPVSSCQACTTDTTVNLPPPMTNFEGVRQPQVFDAVAAARFELPDQDVFTVSQKKGGKLVCR